MTLRASDAELLLDEDLFRSWTLAGASKMPAAGHPAYGLKGGAVLAVSANARMRRDLTQVVLYGSVFLGTWSRRLTPALAVLVACLDGQRTLDDVSGLLRGYWGGSEELNDFKVRHGLATIDAFGPSAPALFSRQDEPSRPFQVLDPRDYVIAPEETRLEAGLDLPISMMWMPTSACQTNCVYCYATRRPVPESSLLPDRRVRELFEEAAEIGVCSVNVDGGDALCRRNITDLLAHATSCGLDIDLSTKCYVSPDMARRLHDAGIRIMQFGFDAPYPELFDRIVRRKGHFERTVESIRNCTDAGIVCRTNSILVQDTYRHVRDLVTLLHALPLRDMKIASAFRSAHRYREGLLLTEDQKQWLREEIAHLKEEFPEGKIKFECQSDYRDMSDDQRAEAFRNFPRCGAGREIIIVTPDGRVSMCEQSPQESEFVVGSVRRRSLRDVWRSEEARNFMEVTREQFRGTACHECEEFEACQVVKGGCFMLQYKAYGTRYAPHPACPKAPPYDVPLQ